MKIWSGVLPLSILGLLISAIFILAKIGRNANEVVDKDGIQAVGIVFDEGKRFVQVRYLVDGNEFVKGVPTVFSRLQDGERYVVKYLQEDPTSIVVYFDKPILFPESDYLQTKCESIEKSFSILTFQFEVNGQKIVRETLYKENQSLDAADYVVYYQSKNPKVGYLISRP